MALKPLGINADNWNLSDIAICGLMHQHPLKQSKQSLKLIVLGCRYKLAFVGQSAGGLRQAALSKHLHAA